jgi:hypothetical protein
MKVWHLVTAVTHWPVDSQQVSRRNAMVASTALAQRRAELDEVEEFLAIRRGDHGDSSMRGLAAPAAVR